MSRETGPAAALTVADPPRQENGRGTTAAVAITVGLALRLRRLACQAEGNAPLPAIGLFLTALAVATVWPARRAGGGPPA